MENRNYKCFWAMSKITHCSILGISELSKKTPAFSNSLGKGVEGSSFISGKISQTFALRNAVKLLRPSVLTTLLKLDRKQMSINHKSWDGLKYLLSKS